MASAKKVMVSTRTQLCESTEHWVRQGQPQTRLEGGIRAWGPSVGLLCGWMSGVREFRGAVHCLRETPPPSLQNILLWYEIMEFLMGKKNPKHLLTKKENS